MILTHKSVKISTELHIQVLVCSFENKEGGGDFELCMSHKFES